MVCLPIALNSSPRVFSFVMTFSKGRTGTQSPCAAHFLNFQAQVTRRLYLARKVQGMLPSEVLPSPFLLSRRRVARFGSNRAAQFNIPVGRQRQRDTSGDTAAVNSVRHGRVRSPNVAGHHGVHVWGCWVPSIALLAPAPNGLGACSVGIGFHHCRHRHDVDHRTQCHPGPLVDCNWKRDACRRLRNRLERGA
jgi:hypothetical protein